MSVFQTLYTVEHIDGTIEYGVDMLKFIKSHRLQAFNLDCGVTLAKTRIPSSDVYKMDWRQQRHVVTEYAQCGAVRIEYIHWQYTCKYIVVDGFGRTVHKDVFVNAFLEMYPVKDKHLNRWGGPRWDSWNDCWKTYEYHNYVPGSKPGWNRGRRYRNSKGAKQAMIRYTDNRKMCAYLEEPKYNVSYGDMDYVMNVMYWDDGIRYGNNTRNWKKYRKTQYKQK